MTQGQALPSTRFVMTIMVMMVLFMGSLWGVIELAQGIWGGKQIYAPRAHATILETQAIRGEYVLRLGQ